MERVDPTVTSVAKALKRKYGPSSWDGQVPWERGSMKLVDDVDDNLYMSVVRIFTKDVCFTIWGCTKPAEVFFCRIKMSSLLLNWCGSSSISIISSQFLWLCWVDGDGDSVVFMCF